ncbi:MULTISPECIES: protein phosphatase CheZ [Methylobacterium]|uniref:protein phosphatase CheZ n=1 Tax=Methylobacterium TaxID=407 RepID=UPI001FED9980|nr:protein phosphatase CheZ [Methylobacterium sp. DB0501]
MPREEYDVIEGAMLETARGRWFLGEYAKRNRTADTDVLLQAIGRLENAVVGDRTPVGMERLRFDLIEMAKAISRTKSEIAAIHAPDQDQSRLCAASEALDGIVRTTERATSDILQAAEEVQEVAWTLRETGADSQVCDRLDQNATQIYTACSFQDLTAQRTSRIVNTLRYLEQRLTAMIEIWASEDDPPAPEVDRAAMPQTALDQDDVDQIVATGQGGGRADAEEPAAPRLRLVEPGLPGNLADDIAFLPVRDEPPAPVDDAVALEDAFAEIDELALGEKLARFT